MYKAGFGDSVTCPLREATFADAQAAKDWLLVKVKGVAEKAPSVHSAYGLAVIASMAPPFIYRGPDNVTYFVTEVKS